MNDPILNQQDFLAERFRYMDDHIQQMSRLALLKLQSLQLARRNRYVGTMNRQEIEAYVQSTLLNLVPNSFVLSEEGFHFGALNN